MHCVRGYPYHCRILLFFADRLKARPDITGPVLVLPLYILYFYARRAAHIINQAHHPAFNWQYLSATSGDICLDSVIEFAFGPQPQSDELIEVRIIFGRYEEFEIYSRLQNRPIESSNDLGAINPALNCVTTTMNLQILTSNPAHIA